MCCGSPITITSDLCTEFTHFSERSCKGEANRSLCNVWWLTSKSIAACGRTRTSPSFVRRVREPDVVGGRFASTHHLNADTRSCSRLMCSCRAKPRMLARRIDCIANWAGVMQASPHRSVTAILTALETCQSLLEKLRTNDINKRTEYGVFLNSAWSCLVKMYFSEEELFIRRSSCCKDPLDRHTASK